jgi:hypothetical protein
VYSRAWAQGRMVFTVLINIVLCPFSHISIANATSSYVLVQDVRKPAVTTWIPIDVNRLSRNLAHNPLGSVPLIGLLPTYRVRLVSPAANPCLGLKKLLSVNQVLMSGISLRSSTISTKLIIFDVKTDLLSCAG